MFPEWGHAVEIAAATGLALEGTTEPAGLSFCAGRSEAKNLGGAEMLRCAQHDTVLRPLPPSCYNRRPARPAAARRQRKDTATMQATGILLAMHETAHNAIGQSLDGLTSGQLHHKASGSTINSIAATCAHAFAVEDFIVSGMLQGAPSVLQSGYGEKLGIASPMADALASIEVGDVALLREYAAKVGAATQTYLRSLSATDLDRIVNTGFRGEQPVGDILQANVIGHLLQHSGEMAALKGGLGL